jgi:hypothetical protein
VQGRYTFFKPARTWQRLPWASEQTDRINLRTLYDVIQIGTLSSCSVCSIA